MEAVSAGSFAFREAKNIKGEVPWYRFSELVRHGAFARCGPCLVWDGLERDLWGQAVTPEDESGLSLVAQLIFGDGECDCEPANCILKATAYDPQLTVMS